MNELGRLNQEDCQRTMNLLSRVNNEYLILKRFAYKMKNQMGSHKQYKYLQQLKRVLAKKFLQGFMNKREATFELSKINQKLIINTKREFDELNSLIDKLGVHLLGMMQLKLHCQYTTLFLSIISRVRALVENLSSIYSKHWNISTTD